MNGLEYTDPIQSEVYNYRGWFHPIYPPNSTLLPVDISKYEGSDVNTVLLKEAKQNKGAALEIIKYLIEKKLLSDNWLLHFYDKREYEDLAEITNQNQEYDLALFRQLILKHNWLELGWNGFWDIDVYLPALKYMKQLSPVAAAYFIHRVENRNHIYYDMGVAAIVRSILFQLAKVELEVCPNRWFLLMVQTWLRKHGLINEQAPIAIIPQLLLKSWDGFLKDKQYPWIGIDALYSLAFVFKTPIFYKVLNQDTKLLLYCQQLMIKTQLTLNVPPEQTAYLIDRIKYLRKKAISSK
ncbi:MAG: hypothetical protein HWD59_04560 [Coxiellaceae bacterium]|nr:MAG: hypothetical protein HWD59_04560 [Coxiellaceae bacterium]